MIITIDYIETTRKGKLIGDPEIIKLIRDHFSQERPGSIFAKKANKFAQTREYVITPTGLFNIGMFEIIEAYIRHDLNIQLVFTDKLVQYRSKKYGYNICEYIKFPLRDYQRDIVQKCLNTINGVVVLGTGGGKTLTMCSFIQTIYNNYSNKAVFKCLVVVPDLGLVTQTYNDFIEYGCDFKLQKWTGNKDDVLTKDSNVIICNMQVLQRRFHEEEWLKYVDLLIVDEVHRTIAPKFQKILGKIRTENRYGFTGTLPINTIDLWEVIGTIGPNIYEKRSKELRDEKYLVNVSCQVLKLNYRNTHELAAKDGYESELKFLQEHKFRNNVIKQICAKISNNILLLVNRIEHGEILKDVLNDCGKQVFFIRGSIEVSDREKIKSLMEVNNNVVCIAISKIFSTGVNIKNLHHIMFCAGGKAFIQIVQSIGRGLRLHPSKTKLTLFDICDNLKYGENHYIERQKIYEIENIKINETNIIEK